MIFMTDFHDRYQSDALYVQRCERVTRIRGKNGETRRLERAAARLDRRTDRAGPSASD